MAYEWTAETAAAMIAERGAVVNIGQVTPAAKRWLDCEAREGRLIKYRGYWNTLLPHTGMGPLKTIWAVNTPEFRTAIGFDEKLAA